MTPPELTERLDTTTPLNGTRQINYNGMPLYRFVGEASPGDAKGQGIDGLWFVVPPVAANQ